jgi:eukaryotic-like serine/threonine-protein kinase
VHRAPDWLVLHDISGDGRVLLSRNTARINIACKAPGDVRERDLSWFLASEGLGLSPDGETLVFTDPMQTRPSGNSPIFLRRLDGTSPVPIGEGREGALSPDGKWVLALSGENLVLLPTGAGAMVTLPKDNAMRVEGGKWLGDSMRVLFTGVDRDGKFRGYIQEVPAGVPRAITPEGVVLADKAAVRDDDSVLGRVDSTWKLFPIQGGDGQPVSALRLGDIPLQWSDDGKYVYTVDNVGSPRPPAVDVFRVELATGVRVLWKTLTPSDPVGVEDQRESVLITPDAHSYCYSYSRRLGDLFVVAGLK